jgi:hypothetical protein
MNVGQLVERVLAGETQVLGENPTQCHFTSTNSTLTDWDRTRIAVVDCRSYGAALPIFRKKRVMLPTLRLLIHTF